MAKLFGTDGVRGIANSELCPGLAFLLGRAAVQVLGKRLLLGKDTRRSADMLEAAVAAGVTSAGGDIYLAGVIPTPGVAALVAASHEYDGGIVISASHNPPEYNGIKFFNAQGYKLNDKKEAEIEALIPPAVKVSSDDDHDAFVIKNDGMYPTGDNIGCIFDVAEKAMDYYVKHAIKSVDTTLDFSNIKVALDLGHGASVESSKRAFEALGISFEVINDTYNGTDINVNCGSTNLEPLISLVKEKDCDFGIAHDGDADRTLAVTKFGDIVDGDAIEAICALALKRKEMLSNNTVVSTVMCNLGFRKVLADAGITVLTTDVGDKYVLQKMLEVGADIGGEQSGHMIFSKYATTGDGLITALQLISCIVEEDKSLDELLAQIPHYPQVLENVTVGDKLAIMNDASVQHSIHTVALELGDSGRILVRPSGTEPYIRVMAEATNEVQAKEAITSIVEAIKTCEQD